jgi:FkbM family methyltransferase
MVYVLLGLVATAVVALAVIMNQRHARLMRRLRRLERAENDLLRLRRVVYADQVEKALARAGLGGRGGPHLPIKFTSQFGEDMLLWDLFDGSPNGFYIEVGGHDGHTDSVTYPFEAAGWTGVLIEPLPERAEACRRLRTRSHVVHAALSKRGSTGVCRLNVLTDSADVHGDADPIAHMSDQKFDGVYTKRFDTRSRIVEAPLTTMDEVLEAARAAHPEQRLPRIDFASIDVEGHELDLLDGFDLAKHRPRVILIEDLHLGRTSALKEYLEARGYQHAMWFALNRLMIRTDQPELLRRAHALSLRVPFPTRHE